MWFIEFYNNPNWKSIQYLADLLFFELRSEVRIGFSPLALQPCEYETRKIERVNPSLLLQVKAFIFNTKPKSKFFSLYYELMKYYNIIQNYVTFNAL